MHHSLVEVNVFLCRFLVLLVRLFVSLLRHGDVRWLVVVMAQTFLCRFLVRLFVNLLRHRDVRWLLRELVNDFECDVTPCRFFMIMMMP